MAQLNHHNAAMAMPRAGSGALSIEGLLPLLAEALQRAQSVPSTNTAPEMLNIPQGQTLPMPMLPSAHVQQYNVNIQGDMPSGSAFQMGNNNANATPAFNTKAAAAPTSMSLPPSPYKQPLPATEYVAWVPEAVTTVKSIPAEPVDDATTAKKKVASLQKQVRKYKEDEIVLRRKIAYYQDRIKEVALVREPGCIFLG